MRFERRFMKYQAALKFRNRLMFSKRVKNPRIKRHKIGWAVTYEAKKFVG